MTGENKLTKDLALPTTTWCLTGLRWAYWLLTPSPVVVVVSLWMLRRSQEPQAIRRAWFGLFSGLLGLAAMLLAVWWRWQS